MQFRRIEIKAFRKLRHVTVDEIGGGLTVIVGDNEAGKSTVLSALRAVLFERHRVTGAPVERMLPYGQNVRPEITIDFEIKGVAWRLYKAFHQRPEALLSGPTTITGDAVEEKLAELFGFVPPGKGASKRDEHQGLYGLLWVDQGWAHRSLGVGGGRETLASALEGEVGQIVGGERGRALIAAAAERKEAFWGRNDRPKGAYKQLAETLSSKQERREALVKDLSHYDGMVAALARCQEALARHARDQRLARAVETLAATRDTLTRAESFERELNDAAQRFAVADKNRAVALDYRRRRTEMVAKVEQTEKDVAEATRVLDELRILLGREQQAADAAERRRDACRRTRMAAEARVRGAEEADVRRSRDETLRRIEAQLRQAEALALGQREALAVVATHRIAAKDVTELDRLEKASAHARAQLRAASVEVTFVPDGSRAIAVDGVPSPDNEVLRIATDVTIDLEGFGRVLLRPGGGTAALAGAAEEARRRLDDALRRWNYADVTEARTALARRSEAEHSAANHAKLLKSMAPEGIEALRQSAEIERHALAVRPSAQAEDHIAAPSSIDDLRLGRDRATDDEREAEAEARGALARRDGAARDVAVAVERAANARARHADAVAELGSSRAQTGDDALRDNLLDSERALTVAAAALDRAKSDLAGADAATARLDFERAERAERTIRADIDRLNGERRELEIELNVRGRAGLGEDLAELDGEIERLKKEKETQDLEAEASRLLFQTLSEAQQESKDRWLGPVREKIRPYLRFIEPDSDIVLNDQTLEIEGLIRNGQQEPFTSLSVGAREQVAVITRLALADILRASGVPSALILDDALVNTDEGRLERMHRVLQTAAKSLQVLVLTCREKDFIGLGDLKRL